MLIRLWWLPLFFGLSVGCSTESTRGAAEGATAGAVAGAVGGMVTALVFGGDVGEAAAQGAVWAGSAGAVSGGMQGARQASNNREIEAQQRAQQAEKLRGRVGEDAYLGLEALAQCKHNVAIAYAETAQQSSKKDHALAGYWLEVMAVGERDGESAAAGMLPELVENDPKLTSTDQARTLLGEVMGDLQTVRKDYGLAATCG